MKLKLKQQAPDFIVPDQSGKKHALSQYKSKWVLLYFYPKDDTPGCTAEACALRDSWKEFSNCNAMVLGVSVDSVKSHQKFKKKYALPFTLLSDQDKKVVKLYGVWGKKKFMGKEYLGTFRTSFLVNPKGKIVKIYEHVNPAEHAKEVLEDLKRLVRV